MLRRIFLLLFFINVQAQDTLFISGFDPFETPGNSQQASRFLEQATFGQIQSEITALSDSSYLLWIRNQQEIPISLHRRELELLAIELATNGGTPRLSKLDRRALWFKRAITSPDQLRQRMAFALSQIFVISDENLVFESRNVIIAEYYDILLRNAFGNYRDLLEDVTRSPAMGYYLSHRQNRKKELIEPVTNTYIEPDENYAREIMQLFSIGLLERNSDFTLIDGDTSQPGIQPIPTYDQNIITNLSRVLTGFTIPCSGGDINYLGIDMSRDCQIHQGDVCVGANCNFYLTNFFSPPIPIISVPGLRHPDAYAPMVCYPRFHDTGREINGVLFPERPALPPYDGEPYRDKRIIGFWPGIGSGPLPPSDISCDGLTNIANPTPTQAQQQQQCLDYCDDELDNALDALFYHPNVGPMMSRQLIQRFITSNPSPQYIEDIASVFNNNGSGVRGDLGAVIEAVLLHPEARLGDQDGNFGKLKEPLIKLTQFFRAMETVSPDPDQLKWRYTMRQVKDIYGQRPLGADSVFNFYTPDYSQPGELSSADLYSPEFQILNDITAVRTHNDSLTVICSGYGTVRDGATESNCRDDFHFVAPTDRAYIPPAILDAIPADFEGMVEALNVRLMHGKMSGTFTPATGMKGILKTELESGFDGAPHRLKVLHLIHLIYNSPEFSVQR